MSSKRIQIIDSLVRQAENANTLDGKTADEFASASDVEQLKTLVGDTKVSTQISDAIEQIDTRVAALESVEYVEITSAEIQSMFA